MLNVELIWKQWSWYGKNGVTMAIIELEQGNNDLACETFNSRVNNTIDMVNGWMNSLFGMNFSWLVWELLKWHVKKRMHIKFGRLLWQRMELMW